MMRPLPADEEAIEERRSAEWDLRLQKQCAISALQVRGQDSGDCLDLNAASGGCMNYNVESLDDDYFLHPDAKSILDTGQSHLAQVNTEPSKEQQEC